MYAFDAGSVGEIVDEMVENVISQSSMMLWRSFENSMKIAGRLQADISKARLDLLGLYESNRHTLRPYVDRAVLEIIEAGPFESLDVALAAFNSKSGIFLPTWMEKYLNNGIEYMVLTYLNGAKFVMVKGSN